MTRTRGTRTTGSTPARPIASGDGFSQAMGLVLGPLALAFLGRGLDGLFGITPVLTIVFAIAGIVGAFATAYYRYIADMDALDAGKPWTNVQPMERSS